MYSREAETFRGHPSPLPATSVYHLLPLLCFFHFSTTHPRVCNFLLLCRYKKKLCVWLFSVYTVVTTSVGREVSRDLA